jgi:hypothetical protein
MESCYVCKKAATGRCAHCHQSICRAHEQMGLNERKHLESLCPHCAERQHQERLRNQRR